MALQIRHEIAQSLPSSVTNALSKLPAEQQAVFEEEYSRKKRNKVIFLLLAIFFPIHFFLEGRTGLGIFYILTIGGCGLWWLFEIVTVWSRTQTYNEDLAKTLLRDMKIMGS